MRQSRSYGSVRGVRGNSHPYRDTQQRSHLISMHGHLDQDIPLPVASLACPGGKCWFLRARDAREDHGQNDLVVLNRELAAAILARGLPAPAPS